MKEPHPDARSEEDRRVLVAWAVECAERLLPMFAAVRPGDTRLVEALEGARAFARGGQPVGPARGLAQACHAAARDAGGDPVAVAVARVCGHAVAIAYLGSHARGVPYYTGKALAADPARAAAEHAWQRARLPEELRTFVYGEGAE